MSIQIGAKPENDFTNPLGLLSDCHRRIEKFLAHLLRIARDLHGETFDAAQRSAFEGALNYFQCAAPLHTQDEELSLFPRMRAAGGEEAASAFAAIAALEADHDTADIAHAEIDSLGRKWLRDGSLPGQESDRLVSLLVDLQVLYAAHIEVEDSRVFALAGRILPANEVARLGREMAVRRALDPDQLPSISRCQIRKLKDQAA